LPIKVAWRACWKRQISKKKIIPPRVGQVRLSIVLKKAWVYKKKEAGKKGREILSRRKDELGVPQAYKRNTV